MFLPGFYAQGSTGTKEKLKGGNEQEKQVTILDTCTVNSTSSQVLVLDNEGCFLKVPLPIKFTSEKKLPATCTFAYIHL